MGRPSDLVQGTLDVLIHESRLSNRSWAIAKGIERISRELLQVQQGSLYPAFDRLEQRAR